MGIATMLLPETVLTYCFNEKYDSSIFRGMNKTDINPITKFTMQCFGAQATLCGLLILTTEFTANSFKAFGTAMISFFVFDYMAYSKGYLNFIGALGDAVGNTVFVYCSWMGYKILNDKNQ